MGLMSQVGLEFIARNKADAQVRSFNRSLATTGRSMQRLLRTAAGFAGFAGFGLFLKDAIQKAGIQEQAVADLTAALRNNGDEYQSLVPELKDYAAELQRITIYADEQIISQLAYARNLGVTADRLRDTAKAAIGLSAKYRIDLQAAMMLVGRAFQGQTQMLTRYGIVLDDSLDSTEKFNELLRIGAIAFGLAEEAAQSNANAIVRWRNAYGDIKEKVGTPFLSLLADSAEAMLQHGSAIDRWSKDTVEGIKLVADTYRKYLPAFMIYRAIRKRGGGGQDLQTDRASSHIIQQENELLQRMLEQGRGLGGNQVWEENFGEWWRSRESAESQRRGGLRIPSLAERSSGAGYGDAVRANAQEVMKMVREEQEFIRNQHYMTRQEKITRLQEYLETHGATLKRVEGAEKVLHDEIARLQAMRLDQMRVFYAEMKENAENFYLVQMEYSASFTRQVRQDFGTLWDPFIDDTKGAKEIMNDFFRNFFINLAKAQAQMAMFQVFDAAIGPALGGISKALFGGAGSLIGLGGNLLQGASTALGSGGGGNNITIQAMDSVDVQWSSRISSTRTTADSFRSRWSSSGKPTL
jgi:hypothetical protein